MTTKQELYRDKLNASKDQDRYLMKESGLPGPRANLELVQAAADVGDARKFKHWISLGKTASVNSPQVFPAVCGVVGLGKLVAEGKRAYVPTLRQYASDERWRIREAVAMALQRWGDADMDALVEEMKAWSSSSFLEQRAAAAALCEPRLLQDQGQARQVLALLDSITESMERSKARKSVEFGVLRQAMGYCWSVAVAAAPMQGKPMMEKWLSSEDKDIRWVMKENLKKNRLARLDAEWVTRSLKLLKPR